MKHPSNVMLRTFLMLASHLRKPLLDFLKVFLTCLLPGLCLAIPPLFVGFAILALHKVDHYYHPNQAVSTLKVLNVMTSMSIVNMGDLLFS